ncbi:hypothetical protein SK128_013776 [Halocaridina rubra]|uniref:Uncharacterized protein n=1 Tax=Halocaridina rubra TaxID=373956 RepID=A0AAN9A8F5_HALRR
MVADIANLNWAYQSRWMFDIEQCHLTLETLLLCNLKEPEYPPWLILFLLVFNFEELHKDEFSDETRVRFRRYNSEHSAYEQIYKDGSKSEDVVGIAFDHVGREKRSERLPLE